MNFVVASRQAVGQSMPDNQHILISVSDPDSPGVNVAMNKWTEAILPLRFHDLDNTSQMKNGIVITDQHADNIVTFVLKHKSKVETIVCQCEAGISRSAGMAAALSLLINGVEHREGIPNITVKRKILAAAERAGWEPGVPYDGGDVPGT